MKQYIGNNALNRFINLIVDTLPSKEIDASEVNDLYYGTTSTEDDTNS